MFLTFAIISKYSLRSYRDVIYFVSTKDRMKRDGVEIIRCIKLLRFSRLRSGNTSTLIFAAHDTDRSRNGKEAQLTNDVW